MTFCNNQPMLGEAKSEAGNRTIPLDAQLEAILLLERKESGFVLGDGEKPLTERTSTRLWQRIGKKIDLHDATPHIFQHTYISMMTCAKSPIFIKTTRIDRLQSEKSHGASSDMGDALRLVRFKKSSNIRKNLLQNEKKQPPTARSSSAVSGAPNRIRTCGLLIRSQTLYPAELWVLVVRSERNIVYQRPEGLSTVFFTFFQFLFETAKIAKIRGARECCGRTLPCERCGLIRLAVQLFLFIKRGNDEHN